MPPSVSTPTCSQVSSLRSVRRVQLPVAVSRVMRMQWLALKKASVFSIVRAMVRPAPKRGFDSWLMSPSRARRRCRMSLEPPQCTIMCPSASRKVVRISSCGASSPVLVPSPQAANDATETIVTRAPSSKPQRNEEVRMAKK
ncbi:hypothetical protein D9M68_403210 [compost metagenome]